jgi:hypothetical protein
MKFEKTKNVPGISVKNKATWYSREKSWVRGQKSWIVVLELLHSLGTFLHI